MEGLPHNILNDDDMAGTGINPNNTQYILAVVGDPNPAYNAKAPQAGVEPYVGTKTVTIRVQATGEGRLPTEAEIGELLQKGKLSPNEEQIKGFMAKMGVDLSGKQDDGEGWKGAYASAAAAAAAVANTHAEPTGMVTVFVPSGEAQQTGSA